MPPKTRISSWPRSTWPGAQHGLCAADEIRAVEKLIAEIGAAKADKERRQREAAERQRRAAAEAEEQRKREEEENGWRRSAPTAGSSGGSSGGGSVDFVGVDADCIGGNRPSDTMRISLSGGPGYISANNKWNPTITDGFGRGIAGTYNYQATFGRTRFFNPDEGPTHLHGLGADFRHQAHGDD